MITDRRLDPLFRALALLIITAVVVMLIRRYDASSLSLMDSLPTADYLEHQRHLHGHSYLFLYVAFFVQGGFYLGAVELIVYLLRLCFSTRKPSA